MTETTETTHGEFQADTARHAREQEHGAWITSPRARAYVYGVAIAVLAALGVLGILGPELIDAFERVIGAVLLVGAAAPALALANTPRGDK